MSRKWMFCKGLTGGVLGALDSILSTDLTNYSTATTEDSDYVYFHKYSTTSALDESVPAVIKPDNLGIGIAGRWLLVATYGTAGITQAEAIMWAIVFS